MHSANAGDIVPSLFPGSSKFTEATNVTHTDGISRHRLSQGLGLGLEAASRLLERLVSVLKVERLGLVSVLRV